MGLPDEGGRVRGSVFHRRKRIAPGNNFRLKLSSSRPIFSYVEDIMADRPDDSRRDNRGSDVRSIGSRTPKERLTPERTAEIRLRILERAYDSPQVAAAVARLLLQQGEI
jgi:hypothetical protein